MTGFGTADVDADGSRINIAVRALNGRFLEVRLHAPREFMPWESKIKKMISSEVTRGSVDLFITRKGNSRTRLKVHGERAKEWMSIYKKLSMMSGLEVSSALLLRLADNPQIVEVEENSEISHRQIKLLEKCIHAALKKLNAERKREGLAMQHELQRIVKQLSKVIAQMGKLRERAKKELENRLRSRIVEAQSQLPVDAGRFSEELIYHLDRSDIREEISRLREHLKECEHLIRSGHAEGRKLDFYSQELLREVNTIGSKSSVAALTQAVVDAKGLIENFKEQVQNIE